MTLTDKPLSELEALRDRQASELAETEAAIAAKASEPDWTPAVKAYCEVTGLPYAENAPYVRKGLIAALPLAPAAPDRGVKAFARAVLHGNQEHQDWLIAAADAWVAGEPLPKIAPETHAPAEPVDDAWVEKTAREIATRRGITGASNLVPIRADEYRNDLVDAICLALARCTRWPGEAELRAFRAWAASLTVTDMNEIVAENGITAGMVVSQEAVEQVRRIDRILGAAS